MPLLALYIDVTTGNLLSALDKSSTVDITTLPLYFPDTIQLQIYLMQPVQSGGNPNFPQYTQISTAGLALELEFNDGRVDAGRTVYASQYEWNTDPNYSYFYATVNLNTVPMQTLIEAAEPGNAQCWLKMAYVGDAGQVDVFSEQISVRPGIGTNNLIVPAGLTPLAQEVADQRYLRLKTAPGQGIIWVSPAGKEILQRAVDNADGTASVVSTPLN